ncbi:transcriptional repressor TCF25-domain-containing protein [Aspergillus cavernicola]|uniref:Transcriptional repressor TCF25-domain-containing protein n=1 Tax=Aspergillus cavernicola TaxID=176166 RepID=A0ABR4ILU2_9EURO
MSSRAIRKLQKLREQELQQAEQENHDSSEDELVSRQPKPKLNAFDLLNAADEEDDDDNEQQSEAVAAPAPVTQSSKEVSQPTATDLGKKKKKKGKNKKKKNSAKQEPTDAGTDDKALDEIDRALKELAVHSSREVVVKSPEQTLDDSFPKAPEDLLSIESKTLNATNEMRKLFGNVVLENFETDTAGSGRRRDRAREMVDLGRALTGRYSPASRGQSLAGVTQRRNILFQGKDEWPRAPSGGLGMELLKSLPNGAAVYRVLHNATYKDVQRQFDLCVESMDPQRMIQLLQYNPYHISTVLQVSEIAKHQGDHAVSADLLERALFNFGRSVHSSFGNRLKEGRARLDFVHSENRELWLVGWRYIANLGMKGTWRTAYEWAKLLLSLDLTDPYCMRLMIDNLALRGREFSHFIELCTQTRLSKEWEYLPNIQCSLALAYLRLNKPKECREQLRVAMTRYPWVFCKIAQELDIKPMPKRIWGKMPPTDSHELFTELYIARAKDLWNTPEVVSILVEVADTLAEGDEPIEPPEITLDIARHVVLSDIPRVTTHLPTRFVSGRISANDPLPPYESEAFREQSDPTPSYLSQVPGAGRPQWLRNLLDQLNNGAIHFPRFRAGEGEEPGDDDASLDGGLAGDQALPPAGPEEQVVLENWILGAGLHSLGAFIRQYGVDRGNWDLEVDYSPLHEYADALNTVEPTARQSLLDGAIRDAVGPIVVDLLREELEFLQQEDDES